MLPILRTSRGWRCLHDASNDGCFLSFCYRLTSFTYANS